MVVVGAPHCRPTLTSSVFSNAEKHLSPLSLFNRLEHRMSEQSLIRRINRRLPEYHQLHKARPHEQFDLGPYFVVDHYRNVVVDYRIDDLETYFVDLADEQSI
jgi:hypothetical protein